MRWICLDVASETVQPAVDEVWFDELTEHGYEVENEPHVTLVPGFDSTVEPEIPQITEPQPIEVTGYRFWPDMEKPMIVMLDVSQDMRVNLWRDDILEQIGQDSVEHELAPPHVTLFKAGENGDEDSFSIDPHVRDRLVDKVYDSEPPQYVAMTGVQLEDWKI